MNRFSSAHGGLSPLNSVPCLASQTLSIYSFMKLFPNEEKAVKFFENQILGETPICPYCQSKDTASRPKRNGHRCKKCRKDFSIRVGTIFENSKLPLHKWLYAMYLLVTARKGISSLQLSKELDITQKTAWFLLQRIHEVMCQHFLGHKFLKNLQPPRTPLVTGSH
ncbi:MAG: transposase [Gammaproteobacteria bacterium]|nr:transposase [Gammaproteobacteria bacterium]